MVSKVVPPDALAERTLAFARRIAALPTMTALMVKECVNQTVDTMGFTNSLQACFHLHQLNHAHWAEIHDDHYPRRAPRGLWPTGAALSADSARASRPCGSMYRSHIAWKWRISAPGVQPGLTRAVPTDQGVEAARISPMSDSAGGTPARRPSSGASVKSSSMPRR